MKKVRFLFAALILAAGAYSQGQSLAQTIAPAADGTGTHVIPQGNRYDISGGQTSRDGANLFHSFQKFGLSQGQIANFLSNPNIRNILGRVTGGDASYINGLIQVTGGNSNLFLMNPAGIVFGPNASLNVPADFTATTATGIGFGGKWFNGIGNNNWAELVGEPSAFAFGSQPGAIANLGNLSLQPGRNLALIGGSVLNAGTLSSPGGNITVAAVPGSSMVRISQPGHLLSLEVGAGIGGLGEGLGFNPPSLPELLTGSGLSHASQVQVNGDGSIQLVGSQIAVPVETGVAIASGTISITQIEAGKQPGAIAVLGNKVGVIGANIDASGVNGGGTVLIGGDYQGKGTIPTALFTFVSSDSTIKANGFISPFSTQSSGAGTGAPPLQSTQHSALSTQHSSAGGRVIVWADKTTVFHGTVTARGSDRGNGGFVEISGKENLIFNGRVDVSSTGGRWGTLLLDPRNITISNEADTQGITAALPEIFSDEITGDVTLNAATLENQAGNIVLEATDNITIEPGVSLNFVPGGSITLTADAGTPDGVGAFSMDASQSITAPGRNLAISGASVTVGRINTAADGDGGNITLNATGGNIITGNLDARSLAAGKGGNITLTVSGGTGFINTTAGDLNARSLSGNGGEIALSTASGDILAGNVLSNALGAGNGGKISLSVSGETGNIDTSAGTLASSSQTGNGGEIALSAGGGSIVTGNLLSAVISGAGTGGQVALSVTGGTGGIDTRAADINASSNEGNGGAISLTSTGGNLLAGDLNSVSNRGGNGGNITLRVTQGTGAIDTGSGTLTASSFSGKAGEIQLTTAGGNITTGNVNARSTNTGTGGNIALAVTEGTGFIDTSAGTLDVSSLSGSGGNIALSVTGGNIITADLNARSLGEAAGGNITLSVREGTGFIDTRFGSLDSSSASGNAGDISLQAPESIATSSINAKGLLGTGNVSFTGNEIDFTASVEGSGTLLLQPFTASQAIALGGADNTPALDLTAAEFAQLQGFSSVTIGQQGGTGAIAIGSAGALDLRRQNFDLILRGGDTNFYNTITLRDRGNFSLNTGAITSAPSGTDIAIAGESTLALQASGSVGTADNPLETSIRRVSATATNLFLRNRTALDLGAVNIAGNLEVTALSGNLTDTGPIFAGGYANFTTGQSGNEIVLDNLTIRGAISINTAGAGGNAVIVNNAPLILNLSNVGGNLTATARSGGIVTAGNIAAGGDIILTGDTLEINSQIEGSGNLVLQPFTPNNTISVVTNAAIALNSSQDVIAGDIETRGQDITLSSTNGAVIAGNLTSNGGAIALSATSGIRAGTVNATAGSRNGSVSLSTAAGDIEVRSIAGGNVEITTPKFFRATEAPEGISLSGSSIVIRHGGGNGETVTPFTVGDAAINGTAGAISAGSDRLATGTFSRSYSIGQIQIITPEPQEENTPPDSTAGETTDETAVESAPANNTGIETPIPSTTVEATPPVEALPANPQPAPLTPAPSPSAAPPPVAVATAAAPPANNPPTTSQAPAAPPPSAAPPPDFSGAVTDLQATARSLADGTRERTLQSINQPVLADFSRDNIQRLLDSGKVAEAVSSIEGSYSQEIEAYIGHAGQSKPQSFPQIQQQLRDIETQIGIKSGIIYVFSRPQQLDVMLVSPNGEPIYKKLPEASRAKVLQVADEFRSQIIDPRKLGSTSYQASARQLYQWIVAPLEKDLESQGITTLMFSLDSGLRSIPAAALHDGEKFLIEKYSLSLIGSFSLVVPGYKSIKDSQILAMGASEFSDKISLPAVPVELKTIVRNLWPGKSFLNKEFTLDNFQNQRRSDNIEIIHIATHAEFQPGKLENSYIQLWDRKLRLDELQKLEWYNPPVELLVLSACRTALGDKQAELGFAGLAVQAGARTAIASLWYVSDIGTLALMSEFYHNLHTAPIKAEALRLAQLAMIRGTARIENDKLTGSSGTVALPPEMEASLKNYHPLQHPYYWSAFTAIGSPW